MSRENKPGTEYVRSFMTSRFKTRERGIGFFNGDTRPKGEEGDVKSFTEVCLSVPLTTRLKKIKRNTSLVIKRNGQHVVEFYQ